LRFVSRGSGVSETPGAAAGFVGEDARVQHRARQLGVLGALGGAASGCGDNLYDPFTQLIRGLGRKPVQRRLWSDAAGRGLRERRG
jgi:hypothetical protein